MNSDVDDIGCTETFVAVSAHLENLWSTIKSSMQNFPNGHIIIFTMEGESDLPMLTDIVI